MDERPPRRALLFAGGDAPPADLSRELPDDAFVVAADSGVEHALALGRAVDVAVGDFDSCSPAALPEAKAAGTRIERHPSAKDATDLELALDAARAAGARRITIVGGHGGRLDHLLGNALLLAAPAFADIDLDALMGPARVVVVRAETSLPGRVGELVSLLPIGGPAVGVTTRGLRFPLRREDLHPGTTRGVSNEFTEPEAVVALETGVLLAVQPEYRGQP
ncbi:MAG: thiamine diphosphokinase [Acidimicrobiia bacterium]